MFFLGLSIDNELVLLPVAVASHLAMDMVPHVGFPVPKVPVLPEAGGFKSPLFLLVGGLDFAASVAVLVAFCWARPERAGHMIIGAFGAALPDLTYIPEIVFGQRIYRLVPWLKHLIYGFLGPIQRFESPLGTLVDASWAALMLVALGLLG